MGTGNSGAAVGTALPRLEPLRYIRTDVLEVAYFDAGPGDGDVAFLLHGFPYDIHTYIDVISRLVEAGYRVITPTSTGMALHASSMTPPRVRDSKQPSEPMSLP